MYENLQELELAQYKNIHKKYYGDMAAMLMKMGIDEIKKNLHPEDDRHLIDRLDFTTNMIKK